ncbi:MAG: hypothetical protein WB791_04485 [Waddliaceae bacterium]
MTSLINFLDANKKPTCATDFSSSNRAYAKRQKAERENSHRIISISRDCLAIILKYLPSNELFFPFQVSKDWQKASVTVIKHTDLRLMDIFKTGKCAIYFAKTYPLNKLDFSTCNLFHKNHITDELLIDLTNSSTNTWKVLSIKLTGNKKLTDRSLIKIKDFKELKELDLTRTQITDGGLAQILPHLPKLEKLILSQCRNITHIGTESIANLKELKELDLARTQITDEGLAQILPHVPKLEVLNLNECEVRRYRLIGQK